MNHEATQRLILLVTAAVFVLPAPRSLANPPSAFLGQHCIRCHGSQKQEGNLRLDTLTADFTDSRAAATWIEVRDKLNLGEMPPADQRQPSGDDVIAVAQWIAEQLRNIQAQANSTGGGVLLRRLSRTEYVNTVRDLLHVTFVDGEGPQEILPPDGTLEGFDKLSKALLIDPSLMDKYFEAAQFVADRAVRIRPPRVRQAVNRVQFENEVKTGGGNLDYLQYQRDVEIVDDGVLVMGRAIRPDGPKHPYNDQQIPVLAEYAIRVQAGADPADSGKPMFMDVSYHGSLKKRFRVDATIARPQVYEWIVSIDPASGGTIVIGAPFDYGFEQHNRDESTMNRAINERFDAGDKKRSLQLAAQKAAEGIHLNRPRVDGFDPKLVPKLFLDWIEVEGPLQETFPYASTRYLNGLTSRVAKPNRVADPWNAIGDDATAQATVILSELLPRAFRRPLRPQELTDYVAVVTNELEQGEPFSESLKVGMTAILCSPDFLYLFEPRATTVAGNPDSGDQAARTLTDYELATRLSYFLWSSMPDDELFQLAERQQLSVPATLTVQVDRMLADPRSDALVTDFATQWLKINEFDRFRPDQEIYGDSYYRGQFAGIGPDMEEEARAFFREVLRNNESILNFLDSEWLVVNERLAAWYGLPPVEGEHFRRVSLPADSPRGGVIGMGGFHKWGADGNRTKPVERGKYILSVLFNDAPDPPPPNAGEVEPNVRGENLTVRERLLQHQKVAACAGCHRTIDPYGLALENFNAVGLWREKQDGERRPREWGNRAPPIICEGTLPNGKQYSSFAVFKQHFAAQADRFERGFAEKLLVYALGRTLEPSDEAAINSIVSETAGNGHSLRALIHAVIRTRAFHTK